MFPFRFRLDDFSPVLPLSQDTPELRRVLSVQRQGELIAGLSELVKLNKFHLFQIFFFFL